MSKLILTQGGIEREVRQYALPLKGAPVNLSVNGFAVEGKVTNARNRIYTYFGYAGGEFYVEGELTADVDCKLDLPEGFAPRQHEPRTVAYDKAKALRAAKKALEPVSEPPAKPARTPRKAKGAPQQPAA
jgi:hypothetical protein